MAKVKQAKEVSGSRKITPGRSELIFKGAIQKTKPEFWLLSNPGRKDATFMIVSVRDSAVTT